MSSQLTAEEASKKITALKDYVDKKNTEIKDGVDITNLILKLRERRAKNKKK